VDPNTRTDQFPILPLAHRAVRQARVPHHRRRNGPTVVQLDDQRIARTRTCLAVAVSVARLEIVIPCPHELRLVLSYETFDSTQLVRRETIAVHLPDGRQPELGYVVVASDVDMYRLTSITRKEKEPVRAASEDGRTHPDDCRSFANRLSRRRDEPVLSVHPLERAVVHSREPGSRSATPDGWALPAHRRVQIL